MSPEEEMLFSRPVQELPRITAPTASQVCAKSNPSPQAKALLTPQMTPPQYLNSLEKNKMPVDSVHFLAHGLPHQDGICWATQGSRLVAPKLSAPEFDAVKLTEKWLKNPAADMRAAFEGALHGLDFTGPGSWCAQAALWAIVPPPPAPPGMPAVALVAAAVIGAILLAAGLSIGPAMPPIPRPRLPLPMAPLSPEMLLQLQKPQLAVPPIPVLDQAKLMKLLFPFIDLGKNIARGSITCC